MGYYSPDVYGQPESFGLELVLMAEEPGLSYEFDMFGVWRDTATGAVYYGIDGGCSCPSPFEDFTSVDKLTPVSSADELHRVLTAWATTGYRSFSGDPSVVEAHARIAALRFPAQGAVSGEEAELKAAITAAARKALTRA